MKQRMNLSGLILLIGMLTFTGCTAGFSQDKGPYVRIVNLVVDAAHLESFRAALTEDIETAIRTEPGVVTLSAVSDKEDPTHITVFEVYADEAAHQAHQQTTHFIRYKNATQGMVKSVRRREVTPIVVQTGNR